MATIARQNFNALPTGFTFTDDSLPGGSPLTNAGSFNDGGRGLGFQTSWIDTRDIGAGPLDTSTESSGDFIGVNDFSGDDAPDGAIVGGGENNFQFNDGDGRLDLTFDPVDVSAFFNRSLSLEYWINDTGFEATDAFTISLFDGATRLNVLGLSEPELEAQSSGDAGNASEWNAFTLDLDAAIAEAGLDATSISLVVSADTNSGSENIFIDDVAFEADTTAPSVLINEFAPNPTGEDPSVQVLEIRGPAGQTFSGILFSLESDSGSSANTVDRKTAVSGTFDADGLLSVTVDDLENPSNTLVLTGDDATAEIDDVIDPANPTELGTILDAIGVTDNATDPVVGAQLGGTDFAFTGDEPKLVFRDGTTNDLYAINDPDNGEVYDVAGNILAPGDFDSSPLAGDTFGAVNPSFVGGCNGGGGGADRKIHEVQGGGATSPLVGSGATIQGIVTARFQDTLDGFFVQEEDADADSDAATSEGIFVFAPDAPAVQEGYQVTVTGTVGEFFDLTQIADATVTVDSTDTAAGLGAVSPAKIDLPVPSDQSLEDFYEPFEGMLVEFADTLTVTQLFNYERFGEVHLSEGGRVYQYTQTDGPDVDGNAAYLDGQLARRIILDDGSNAQNPDTIPFLDVPEFGGGDTIDTLTGVLNYSFGEYKVVPTEANPIVVDNTNPRQAAPDDVGGSLKVASFNVLNYFTTLDVPGNEGSVNGNDPRGAHSEAELTAQTGKIVAALDAMDADVVGLIEIENDNDTAIKALVTELNKVSDRTYKAVETGVIGGDAIKVGFIYDMETVKIADETSVAVLDSADFVGPVSTLLDPSDALAFDPKNRPAVAVTFEELATRETFTAVNNHFKSKGSAVEGEDFGLLTGANLGTIDGAQPVVGVDDGQGNGSATRQSAADQLADWLATNPTGSTDDDVLILGDLNAYSAETAIAELLEGADDAMGTGDDYTDLTDAYLGDEIYTLRFSGQWGTLDHALANTALVDQVTGVTQWHINADEPAYRDYNDGIEDANEQSFEAKPETLADAVDPDSPFRSSDHDPVIVGLDLATEPDVYTLELLHLTDQELSSADLGDIPRASAILNALEAQDLGNDGVTDNTLRLSSGDLSIPGPFFSASAAVFGSEGIADIQIANEMGFHAVALGNHEFDGGTEALAALIDGSATGDFSALPAGTDLDGQDFTGADFPFLATNLDFASDANLAPLAVAGGQAAQANVVTSSVVQQLNGEQIGIVGAVTPTLAGISSPGTIGIEPTPFDGTPTSAQLDALAAEIQAEVDALLDANAGLNKIVLLAHMQDIDIELALAERLSGVDIIVAGGSNTRLFDDNDRVRDGDTDQGQYPQFVTDADGNTTALVNTDGSVKYVGRLVIDFDAAGNIIPGSYDQDVSGAYATDAQGLADLGAEGLIDPEVQAITDAIEEQIILTESNVFGEADVFLNGNRAGGGTDGVRTQETNLGNLTADANLAAAQAADDTVVLSIKNGGGIRASIGETVVPPGGTAAVRQPNSALADADGNIVKPEGGISQNDISTVLAFNNDLVAVTLTRAEIVGLLEHGVSALPGVAGAFPQIAGLQFSFDESAPAGDRIQSASIVGENGEMIAPLVYEGEIAGSPHATFRVVTLGFLAEPRFDDDGTFIGGGDGYPFPNFNTDPNAVLDDDGNGIAEVVSAERAARIDFVNLTQDGVRTGDATFADDGSEQDALAEYLDDTFNPAKGGTVFAAADTTREFDARIQNLDFRDDDVFDFDNLIVSDGSAAQRFDLTDGIDQLFLSKNLANGQRQRFIVSDFEAGDRPGFEQEDILFSREAGPNLLVYIDNDERDSFVFRNVDSEADLFADLPLA